MMVRKRAHERRGRAVVVFGEVLADVFGKKHVLGGAPFNVARHLQAFGMHPVLISRVGDDALRGEILEAMSSTGMDTRGVQQDISHSTGRVMVQMKEAGHNFEILPNQAYDHIHAGLAHMVTLDVRPEMVYFGTLAQRTVRSAMALTAIIRSIKATRFYDINLRKPWYDTGVIERSLQRANIVKLNEEELAELATLLRMPMKNDALQNAALLLKRYSLDALLVTCGAQGSWKMDKESKVVHADVTPPEHMVDTVGAGDGFAAVCMLGALLGWHPARTLPRANAFAAAICGIQGAIPPSRDFYEPFISEWKL